MASTALAAACNANVANVQQLSLGKKHAAVFAHLLAGQLTGDCTISASCPRFIEVCASPP